MLSLLCLRNRRVKSYMRTFTWTLMLFLLTHGFCLTFPDEPRTLESLLAEASEKIRADDLTGAETVLRRGLNAFGDQPDLLKVLGSVYQRQMRFQESIEVFRNIL